VRGNDVFAKTTVNIVLKMYRTFRFVASIFCSFSPNVVPNLYFIDPSIYQYVPWSEKPYADDYRQFRYRHNACMYVYITTRARRFIIFHLETTYFVREFRFVRNRSFITKTGLVTLMNVSIRRELEFITRADPAVRLCPLSDRLY